MPPVTTTITAAGKTYTLAENATTTLPTRAVTVNVTNPPTGKGSVHLRDGKTNADLLPANQYQPPFTLTLPATLSILSVEVRPGDGTGATARYTLAFAATPTPPTSPTPDKPTDTGTPPVVTVPPAPPVVVIPPVTPAPAKLTFIGGLGVCCDGYALTVDDCKLARQLYAVGVRRFRWFGSGAQHGNVKYTGSDAKYAALIYAALPDVTCTIHFGVSEQQDDGKGNITRYATPWTTAEKHTFWGGVAAAFAGDKRSKWEIENESNSPHYLYFGQDQSKRDPRVIAYDVETIQIARQHGGPDRWLVMSTVGLNYQADLHVDTVQSHHDAGVYKDPKVICGVHSYPDGGAVQLRAQFSGIREILGPTVPIEATEFGVHNLRTEKGTNLIPAADVPAAAVQYLAIAAEFGVMVDYYRGHVADKSKWYADRSLLNADGTRNDALCDALAKAAA